jgi:hypothetical protein
MTDTIDGREYHDAHHARTCRELRGYYRSFPWRSLAVAQFAEELARMPAPQVPPRRRSDDQRDADEEAEQNGLITSRYLRGR